MFEIKVDDKAVRAALARLELATGNLAPVMRAIAAELLSQTEANFDREGRPKWPSLSASTLKKAAKTGRSPAKMLQVSGGGLAASVTPGHDASHARIGVNKTYAAIHQFGGQAGRGRKVTIPARPYLPMTAAGELQPEAVDPVLDLVRKYLLKAV